ncbi:hypothetical protein ACER1C_004575 [Vibrio alginolyticus]|nr:hypothetical protein [Vibrio alginolyticus]
MDTGTWITIVLTSNALIIAGVTWFTNLMIKNSEKKNDHANKIRDATIEGLEKNYKFIEEEVKSLRPLKDIIVETQVELDRSKLEISRLKKVVLAHGRKQMITLKYVENQETTISRLELKLLRISSIVRDEKELNSSVLAEIKRELKSGLRTVEEVQRIVDKLKNQVDQKSAHRPMSY